MSNGFNLPFGTQGSRVLIPALKRKAIVRFSLRETVEHASNPRQQDHKMSKLESRLGNRRSFRYIARR